VLFHLILTYLFIYFILFIYLLSILVNYPFEKPTEVEQSTYSPTKFLFLFIYLPKSYQSHLFIYLLKNP